jgi:Sec-independent protein secretion pathway component TatC
MAPTKTVAKRGRGKLPDDPEEFKATLGEHLEELRTRVFRVLGVLILAFTGAWYLEGPAYK